MIRCVLFGVLVALGIVECAPAPVTEMCATHRRALVERPSVVEGASLHGPISEGRASYHDDKATLFPRSFVRPSTRGQAGEVRRVWHCVECSLAELTWLEAASDAQPDIQAFELAGKWIPSHDGAPDVSGTRTGASEILNDVVLEVMSTRGVLVQRHAFKQPWGYVRTETPSGFMEVWWDDWMRRGHSDIAVRATPSDEGAARETLDGVLAVLNDLR